MDSDRRQAYYGLVAQRRSCLRIRTEYYCRKLLTQSSQGVVPYLDQTYRQPKFDWDAL